MGHLRGRLQAEPPEGSRIKSCQGLVAMASHCMAQLGFMDLDPFGWTLKSDKRLLLPTAATALYQLLILWLCNHFANILVGAGPVQIQAFRISSLGVS